MTSQRNGRFTSVSGPAISHPANASRAEAAHSFDQRTKGILHVFHQGIVCGRDASQRLPESDTINDPVRIVVDQKGTVAPATAMPATRANVYEPPP